MDNDEASEYLKGKREWKIHEMLFEMGTNLARLRLAEERNSDLYNGI